MDDISPVVMDGLNEWAGVEIGVSTMKKQEGGFFG